MEVATASPPIRSRHRAFWKWLRISEDSRQPQHLSNVEMTLRSAEIKDRRCERLQVPRISRAKAQNNVLNSRDSLLKQGCGTSQAVLDESPCPSGVSHPCSVLMLPATTTPAPQTRRLDAVHCRTSTCTISSTCRVSNILESPSYSVISNIWRRSLLWVEATTTPDRWHTRLSLPHMVALLDH